MWLNVIDSIDIILDFIPGELIELNRIVAVGHKIYGWMNKASNVVSCLGGNENGLGVKDVMPKIRNMYRYQVSPDNYLTKQNVIYTIKLRKNVTSNIHSIWIECSDGYNWFGNIPEGTYDALMAAFMNQCTPNTLKPTGTYEIVLMHPSLKFV